ncbi:MAG: hypothetical protein JJ913_09710 [Rhizobiaceae bacterium]|nr:hypothetical protein [Rhizobiaceae bacterium]
MSEQGTIAGAGRAPLHLWIVGVLSLLWNAMGAFDYLMTQSRSEWYMSQFSPEQLDYFYSFPLWADAAWALGVWGAFFGSLALLLRRSWAVWLFGVSIAGLVLTSIYNFVLTNGAELMGEGAEVWVLTLLIWGITLALFFYARWLTAQGVLR